MFGLKDVLDPMAEEVREFGDKLLGVLGDIRESLDTQVELTQTTNRLLAVLVEQGSKSPSRARAGVKA